MHFSLEDSGALNQLQNVLAPYNTLDAIRAIAALQLIPVNAGSHLRLVSLAHAASTCSGTGARISPQRLRTLLDSEVLRTAKLLEDPAENPLVSATTFQGEAYDIITGPTEHTGYITRLLSESLEFLPETSELVSKAIRVLKGALRLSNEVVQRAGLERNVIPSDQHLHIPSARELSSLKEAITFSQQDLVDITGSQEDARLVIDQIGSVLRAEDTCTFEVTGNTFRGPLLAQPLIENDGGCVVSIPYALVPAGRNVLLGAIAAESSTAFGDAYSDSVFDNVRQSLRRLGIHYTDPVQPGPIACYREAQFQLDTNTYLHVQSVTDCIEDFDSETVFGTWDISDAFPQLIARHDQISASWKENNPDAPPQILCMTVFQELGRGIDAFRYRPPSACDGFLLVEASHLEILSFLEMGEPLALWKMVRASKRAGQTKYFTPTLLDQYDLYESLGRSFIPTDADRIDFLISSGGSARAHQQFLEAFNPLAVSSYADGTAEHVVARYSEKSVPINRPARHVGTGQPDRAAFHVGAFDLPVWVIGPKYTGERQEETKHHEYRLFCETIAYWLWQAAPLLSSHLDEELGGLRTLNFNVSLPDSLLDATTEEREPQDGAKVDIAIGDTDGSDGLKVVIKKEFEAVLRLPDNEGDRLLLRALISGLRKKLSQGAQERLTDVVIDDIVDECAPHGMKRKIAILGDGRGIDVDPRGLPPFRPVQDADIRATMEDLGNHLFQEGFDSGPLSDISAQQFVNSYVVPYLYKRLQRQVKTLAPKTALDLMVSYHEVAVREFSFHQMNNPSRLACFSSESEILAELAKERREQWAALLAGRFLIEYTASQTASDGQPCSLEEYDQLLATAHLIVNYGFASDLARTGIASPHISITPSGLLQTQTASFVEARDSFLRAFIESEVERDVSSLASRLEPELDDDDALKASMERASSLEFGGHSLEEFVLFFAAAANIGLDVALAQAERQACATLPFDDLIRQIVDRTKFTYEKVQDMIRRSALTPREDYLNPPGPFDRNDIYPWIFNRRLSYLRRPFILRDDQVVFWGPRLTVMAASYLHRLCWGGRLRHTSDEMEALKTKLANRAGHRFNCEVAAFFRPHDRYRVRDQVDKFAGSRIRSTDGNDLGDIDVVVLDLNDRILFLIECKNLSVGRTPEEVLSELKEHFDASRPKSTIVKHSNRTQWVSTHLKLVLEEMVAESVDDEKWSVQPAIVVNHELLIPHLFEIDMPVVTLQRMRIEGIDILRQ